MKNTNKNDEDVVRKLEDQGAFVEIDENGGVTTIRFTGQVYDDSCIEQLVHLKDVAVIDIRDTKITTAGAKRLRQLLPQTLIIL